MLSRDWSSYLSSPSSSQSASLIKTRTPGRLLNGQLLSLKMHVYATHTESSRTKSSCFCGDRSLHKYLIKEATVAGLPCSSLDGNAILCFLSFEKSISSPPLVFCQITQAAQFTYLGGVRELNIDIKSFRHVSVTRVKITVEILRLCESGGERRKKRRLGLRDQKRNFSALFNASPNTAARYFDIRSTVLNSLQPAK